MFTNLATLYEQLGENQKALDYYQKALVLGPTAPLLTSIGALYHRMGNAAEALESYHAALAIHPEVQILEDIGVTQALGLHDLINAAASFSEALKLAPPNDIATTHLFRGEALYRMQRSDAAADDFRAAGDNWLALYRLGELTRALAIRDTPLASEFFPAKRDLYNAAIRRMTHAGNPDPQRIFELFERAHDSPEHPAPLPSVQARLAAGSMLIEYWTGDGETAVLWATKDRSGVATDGVVPRSDISQLLIVPDGAPPPEQFAVSYLPYASLLVRDEPWRTPLMPWRTRRTTVTTKHDLYNTESPILTFNASAVTDPDDPNRSHLVLSPNEFLFRGEIQSLQLANTEMVILSEPDPTQVFSRAFLAAGARSTLTTLRPVREGVTSGMQRLFLRILLRGKSKAAALSEAMLAFPEYASAFLLTGDGQQPTREVLSWWWVIGVALLAAGLIVVLRRS